MYIIMGLGNKGEEYKNTFHNIGFMVADRLAERLDTTFTKEKYKAMIAEARVDGQKVLICKPTTYMNNSGESAVMLKNKFAESRLLVIVDDIDLEKGKIRYREKGSSGTHNGLRSIVSYVGENFERVRVGIGRDKNRDLADFVLSNIKEEDKELFNNAIDEAVKLILEKIGARD